MKPLLAATLEDVNTINFPVLASPKLDGIRVLIIDGVAVSRNLKPIRNKYIQSILGHSKYNGLDGEILVGDFDDKELFRKTSSGVMSEDGEPDFTYYVFDKFDVDGPFVHRLARAGEVCGQTDTHPALVLLEHVMIMNVKQLDEFEEETLAHGHEGVMLRNGMGVYKQGRSTMKEGILLKLKRFKQEEAVIIGFQERMHNANEAKTNALGETERSTHKENLVGRNDLGAILVRDLNTSVEFSIGSGFNDEERKKIWDNKDSYLGQIVTYKFFAYGEYDAPRFPVFKGFRDQSDMSQVA
jgi:DNA ligase-1